MSSQEKQWSLWDRLTQRHDFYDTLDISVEAVIAEMMMMARGSGQLFFPGTTVKIWPDGEGYQFRVAIHDRSTHVIASGRLWEDEVTHWEGRINNGWSWVGMSFCFLSMGSILSLSQLGQSVGPISVFACAWIFVGVYFLCVVPLFGRQRLMKQFVQILEGINI